MNKTNLFTVGARGSKLSMAQTLGAVEFLEREFPGTRCRVVAVETPGDRDLTTPIERTAPDFFTRDLDEAVREGRIDFAIHSAKDLLPPETIADDLDWFWLPNHEDPRDCWVTRKEMDFAGRRAELKRKASFKIGISSARRRDYAAKCLPKAKLLPIRGAIDSRIRQLLDGKFDAVLMAMAGLKRLLGEGGGELSQLAQAIDIEPISVEDLTPPEAQGYLAVVFRAGDERMADIRARFAKAVRFVSAGVGDAGLCTQAGLRDLAQAEVVLYDDLLGPELLAAVNPQAVAVIHVGKRCGAHSMKQPEITRRLCDEARKGRRVVRLKGGDAGLFGRLAEEADALAALKLPFVVRPGVSALTAATTGTGLLLTRRGESTGFSVYTPRRAADAEPGTKAGPDPHAPLVMFMATKVVPGEAARLLAEGWPGETPCALVWDAAGPHEEVAASTLAEAARGGDWTGGRSDPGLFIVGSAAAHRWPKLGWFAGRRVLVTASEAVQARAVMAVEDGGGRPVRWPLIQLVPKAEVFGKGNGPENYDAIVLTSPSSVRIFFEVWRGDRRRLPAFYTCGAGTDAELRKYGVASDVMPAKDFSAAGLIAEIAQLNLRGRKVLRLRSAKAGPAVARALAKAGAKVDDVVLYDNVFCAPDAKLPPFDDVFFASASAVESFVAQYGKSKLRGKGILVMGGPTQAALAKVGKFKSTVFDILNWRR